MKIELSFEFDIGRVLNSKFGQLAINYYNNFVAVKRRPPKGIKSRIKFFFLNLIGRVALFCLDTILYFYIKSLSDKELEKFSKEVKKLSLF